MIRKLITTVVPCKWHCSKKLLYLTRQLKRKQYYYNTSHCEKLDDFVLYQKRRSEVRALLQIYINYDAKLRQLEPMTPSGEKKSRGQAQSEQRSYCEITFLEIYYKQCRLSCIVIWKTFFVTSDSRQGTRKHCYIQTILKLSNMN